VLTPLFTFRDPNAISNSTNPVIIEESHSAPTGSKTKKKTHNFKKLLAGGELIHNVELIDNKAKLIFYEKYNAKKFDLAIFNILSMLQNSSELFQEMFTFYTENSKFYLQLQDGHPFQNGEEVLYNLQKCAKTKRLKVKDSLANGDLIEDITLMGNVVEVHLKATYSTANHPLLFDAFYRLYKCKNGVAQFSEKFERPKRYNTSPLLQLKENHGFKNAQEVLIFLRKCATPPNKWYLFDLVESHVAQVQQPVISSYEMLFNNELSLPNHFDMTAENSLQEEMQIEVPSYDFTSSASLLEQLLAEQSPAIQFEMDRLKRSLPAEFSAVNDNEASPPQKRFRKE